MGLPMMHLAYYRLFSIVCHFFPDVFDSTASICNIKAVPKSGKHDFDKGGAKSMCFLGEFDAIYIVYTLCALCILCIFSFHSCSSWYQHQGVKLLCFLGKLMPFISSGKLDELLMQPRIYQNAQKNKKGD